jgi:hypothetical protein
VSVNVPVGPSTTSTRTSLAFTLGVSGSFERSSINLGIQQGLTPSAGVAGASETLSGFASYYRQLGERLNGTLYASYSKFNTTDTNYNLFQLRAALIYPFWRRVSVALSYGYTRRDSDQANNLFDAGVVDGNSILLQIGTTFDPWLLDV